MLVGTTVASAATVQDKKMPATGNNATNGTTMPTLSNENQAFSTGTQGVFRSPVSTPSSRIMIDQIAAAATNHVAMPGDERTNANCGATRDNTMRNTPANASASAALTR